MNSQVLELLQLFAYRHLPEELQLVSKPFRDLAVDVANTLQPSFMLIESLKALKVAKDWAVNQKIIELGM